MVCKEDLCNWFRNLNPRKRIEYMCMLLHMCLPLELRFVGTVLEDCGKKDYHYLRNAEVAANKQVEINKYKNIPSPEVLRAKIFVTLALMRSSSTTCAQIVYDIIESKLDTIFSFGPGDDSRVVDEVLTVLTLAIHHPAFMFEQRRRLHEHLCALENQKRNIFRDKIDEPEVPLDLYAENHIPHYPTADSSMPVHPAVLCNRHSPIQQPRKVFIQNIEVLGTKRASEKKGGPEYQIQATWSNGEITEVDKQFREIKEFHRQLLEMYPEEKPPHIRLPTLPGGIHQHSSREEHIAEQIRVFNAYFKSLTSLPSHILDNDHLSQFFRGSVVSPAQQSFHYSPTLSHHQPMGSIPDEEEMVSAVPPHAKAMMVRNSHLYYLPPHLNDAASRLPRFLPPQFHSIVAVNQRIQASHTCQPVMPTHHIPLQQHQQPSSEISSTTTSPAGSRSASPDPTYTSVLQLLKLLGLEKYSSNLGGLTVEQLSTLGSEELNKRGLPSDAQRILRCKLDHISNPLPINGLIDSAACITLSLNSTPSASLPWISHQYRTNNQTSTRPGMSMTDNSLGGLSDIASGSSPPVSPGPAKLQGGLLDKVPLEDSSEGSEDFEREKVDGLCETGKSVSHQQGKSAQVKVSPGAGGGSSSPHPSSANSRLTPPDDANAKPGLPVQQTMLPHMAPFHYFHPGSIPAPAPPGLQFGDPKAEVGMIGVVHNVNSNTNNNYTSEVSAGIPSQRPALLQTGVGANPVRAAFKAGQPQPAHTNMGVLQGKNLITMPAEPKPGSPVIPMPFGLRPAETPMGQGMVTNTVPQLEPGVAAPQRMSVYHLPYGRGQGGHMPIPHMHPTQPGVIPFPSLVTRSVQTTLGSASILTVSASHPVTVVTASHQTAATASSIHRSPSHSNSNSNGNMQRDSVNESHSGGSIISDTSLRSSPLQVGGGAVTVTQVAAAPSPPVSHHAGCQACAQYSHNQFGAIMYPPYQYIMSQGPNGLIQHAAIPGYYASNQPLASGVLANGYTPEMYSYPSYPTLGPATGSVYPMMQGNALFPGTSPSQPTVAATPTGNGASTVSPQQPTAVGGGLLGATQQSSNIAIKQRNTGCYNCGSTAHKAADCPESSMETMSGKAVYLLDYKPPEESD